MTHRSGPIYEVTFFVDADIADECDSWIADYVSSCLQDPGTIDCTAHAIADEPTGRVRRVCQHQLASDEALDDFMESAGSGAEQEIEARFGDQVEIRGRVLREDPIFDVVTDESTDCLNCGTRLRGQYCGTCGQRSRSRLISLWELISDAFGDLLELDSRLWQTLIPLMNRPGQLTHDYLQGRRARYMPPFRMYLVLSLLFFVVAFFDPREELGLFFEPETEETSEPAGQNEGAIAQEADEIAQDVIDELTAEGVLSDDTSNGGFLVTLDGEDGEQIEINSECDVSDADLDELPDWIGRRLTQERLQRICERTQIDGGQAFADKMIDNIPAALIVLLPLMAFVLKALYPLSKRYYVEHLLFFVHFHAFFFLILSLQILLSRLATLLAVPETPVVLALVVASFYIPVYLFISMRRVYGQGRFTTFLKYIVLVIAYLFGFLATMMSALAIAAFSI
jgi:hypothetical protein